MGNTTGQPLSVKIAEAIQGINLCDNLPDISNDLGAAVDYAFHNGQGGLLISDPQGNQYMMIPAPSGISRAKVECRGDNNGFLQALGLQSEPTQVVTVPQVGMSRNTRLGIGSMRRFRMA